MKNIALLLSALAAITLPTATRAAGIVFSENFDTYNTGDLVGQGMWAQLGSSVVNPVQVTAAKNVPLANTGQDVQKPFDSQVPHTDGDQIITEFDFSISSAATGDFFAELTSPFANSAFYNRFYVQSSTAGTFKLGLSAATPNTSTDPFYGSDLVLNQTYRVASTWTFVSGAANDTFSMTVDGAPYVSEFAWNSATAEPTALALFNLRQGSTASSPAVSAIDNVVVTVVPEPSSAAFAIFGAAALTLQIRRRRRAYSSF